MSFSDWMETGLLNLLLNNAGVPGIGDAGGLRGSVSPGALWLSLHTADPGEAGNAQTTHEATYAGYARVSVARSGSGWTIVGGVASPAGNIVFPASSSGTTQRVTHACIGTQQTGAGQILIRGAIADGASPSNPWLDVVPGGSVVIGPSTTFALYGGADTIPAAFTAGQWGVVNAGSGQASFNILALPANGGSAITALQYRIGAGDWTSFGATTTGSYTVGGFTDNTPTNVQIRAVNAVNPNPNNASDTKSVTTSGGAAADYIITNGTEWNAVMALGAATLAGKVAEVRGALGAVSISGLAPASTFTIRGGAGGSIRSLVFSGTCNRITFQNAPFQMTGWPRLEAQMVQFTTGSFDNLAFLGCSFRHGYGAGLADFDMTASYPEYARVDNVTNATTASTTIPLTWQDPARTEGFIEFFNRGTQAVYFTIGGAGVTTSVATGTIVAAGTRVRIGNANPVSATHIAVISASGTQQINARTEIGMSAYLASCFSAFGNSVVGRLEIRNCTVRDVNNGIKGIGRPSLAIVMDNDLDRIYQDIMAVPPAPGGAAYIFRNLLSVPFSRSGIAENLSGDARDPHGDFFQSFGDGGGTIGPIFVGGNRARRTARRAGVTHQGVFFSDNDISPSYSGIYVVSEHLIGGATNGISSGEAGFPVGDLMVWGATVVDGGDIAGGVSAVRLDTLSEGRAFVGRTIAQNYLKSGGGFAREESILVSDATSAAALFPNSASIPTALTRAQIEAAWAAADAGTGLGMAATANAIDWNTADHTAVILWQNIASGVGWEDATSQPINSLVTLPLSRVKNRRANQTVTPGAGVEWRAVASDGVTEVQAWTTAGGTVQPDQYVQIRAQTSASGLTSVNFDITINGFLARTAVTTQAAAPSLFHTQSGSGPYFRDPANGVPANTTRMEFRANIYPTSTPTVIVRLFAQESTGCDLEILTNGDLRVTVEDGAGGAVLTNATATLGLSLNQWQEFAFDVDHVAGTATLTKNGVLAGSWSWTPSGSASFQTNREISFLGNSAGANLCPAGWQVEYAECFFTTGGVRTLRRRIAGNAATVNADAWKLGGNAS